MRKIQVPHRKKTEWEIEKEKEILVKRNRVKKSDVKFCKNCQRLFISDACVLCQ